MQEKVNGGQTEAMPGRRFVTPRATSKYVQGEDPDHGCFLRMAKKLMANIMHSENAITRERGQRTTSSHEASLD